MYIYTLWIIYIQLLVHKVRIYIYIYGTRGRRGRGTQVTRRDGSGPSSPLSFPGVASWAQNGADLEPIYVYIGHFFAVSFHHEPHIGAGRGGRGTGSIGKGTGTGTGSARSASRCLPYGRKYRLDAPRGRKCDSKCHPRLYRHHKFTLGPENGGINGSFPSWRLRLRTICII